MAHMKNVAVSESYWLEKKFKLTEILRVLQSISLKDLKISDKFVGFLFVFDEKL